MSGLVSILFLALSAVFMVSGIGILLVGRLRKVPSAKADGEIVGFEIGEVSGFDGSSKRVFYPRVAFVDASGVRHTVISSVAKGAYAYREGQHVDVLYWPTTPEVGFVVGSEHEIFAMFVGGLLVVVGFVFLFAFFGV